MRNICTEAGMMAIRADRDYVVEEDFMKCLAPTYLGDFKLQGKVRTYAHSLQLNNIYYYYISMIFNILYGFDMNRNCAPRV